MDPSEISQFTQDDPILLNYLRARHISPPSTLPGYNFRGARYAPGANEKMVSQALQALKNKKGGFFVEVGAFDGVTSNTLPLERLHNWTGLLIECHPKLVPQLRKTQRKAFVADVCLSTNEKPSMAEIISAKDIFNKYPGSSSFKRQFFDRTNTTAEKFNVTAVPLYSVLAAVGVKVVDFFVLDVQGIELNVLKTFPFDLVFVKIWAVEYTEHNKEEIQEILQIMDSKGYAKPSDVGGDYFFVHKSIVT